MQFTLVPLQAFVPVGVLMLQLSAATPIGMARSDGAVIIEDRGGGTALGQAKRGHGTVIVVCVAILIRFPGLPRTRTPDSFVLKFGAFFQCGFQLLCSRNIAPRRYRALVPATASSRLQN
ncbi:hypothetical protein C8J57DRAFT_1493238 [Mycena rebaudengoi]|nr:hypothetical protein C8J57DRAFT_1493238 [Mycena rebaudengoi]